MRMHMLRKFHASNLAKGENGLTLDEIDSLQGRSKDSVQSSYFYDDPKELKKKYIANMGNVMINVDLKTLTIESPEVLALKKKALELENENKRIKNDIDSAVNKKISEVFQEYNVEEILKKHGL